MSEPILIDTGKSRTGWSFWGPAFTCDQLWKFIQVDQVKFGSADALTQGSMGHTLLAHYLVRTEAQRGGIEYEGEWIEDPDYFLDPEEAVREWARRREAEGVEAACFIGNTLTLFTEYRRREPVIRDRVHAVETLAKLTLGYDKLGRFGLWIDEKLKDPLVLDCPALGDGHPNVPALKHGHPIEVTKRFDAVMDHRNDGRRYIHDHKITAGGVGKSRAEQYSMDGQFAVNRIAGRQMYGDAFGGVVLNLVQRRSPWTVSKQFVPPTPARDAAFAGQIYRKAHDLANLLVHEIDDPKAAIWPMTQNELVCYHRYGKCGAFERCQYGD
ncbi:MAG: hypothetical protein P1V36_00305 [Planctomycetota bacterium]|nr:hypothetical protein [Planctomycetota bacterium]